jgi:hypothetical protein
MARQAKADFPPRGFEFGQEGILAAAAEFANFDSTMSKQVEDYVEKVQQDILACQLRTEGHEVELGN